ncbi:MAG: transglutaminase domain-containing protein [Muribaculaceae bacterium]|nr:transglutaminase domain-containing protein [Muribaculaceae bacterium]
MNKSIRYIAAICVGMTATIIPVSCSDKSQADKGADTPMWLESDSVEAVQSRTAWDFRLTRSELLEAIQMQHPEVTDADIDTFIARHYVEAKDINGEQKFHRKSPRNLNLLNPAFSEPASRGGDVSAVRISHVDSILDYYRGKNPVGLKHAIKYRINIDVPYDAAIAGDTLRVWLPVPVASQRQSDIVIESSYPVEHILSDNRSVHNSIYLEQPAPAPGDTAHFEYVGSFVNSGEYFAPETILAQLKPYDKSSELYRKYTAMQAPHIVNLDSLARTIVGDETNPFKQSELVFDYITSNYPWAGAREYSTIECIPQYVLEEGHGDCGQVTLLYISLMRSLGVPARWESGWVVTPGATNLHDWAETYFEGIGWVPVDTSFGRYTGSDDPEVVNFFSHGIDSQRLAANKGIGSAFYPPKKFVRSETVDFQLGEVECSKGNLFYPAWNCHFEVISFEPIESQNK